MFNSSLSIIFKAFNDLKIGVLRERRVQIQCCEELSSEDLREALGRIHKSFPKQKCHTFKINPLHHHEKESVQCIVPWSKDLHLLYHVLLEVL